MRRHRVRQCSTVVSCSGFDTGQPILRKAMIKKMDQEEDERESFTIKRKGEAGRWNLGKLFKFGFW